MARVDNRSVNEDIRQIIRGHARLSVDVDSLTDDADLYEAGMTSHASVNVMLALEEEWSIEIPEEEMESVKTVGQAIDLVATKLGVS